MTEIDHPVGPLELTYRWYREEYLLLAAFCAVFDGCLLIAWAMLAAAGNLLSAGFSTVGLLTVAIGVVNYWTIAQLKNQTTIVIDAGVLTVQHGPLPWVGDKTVPADQLAQLYCEKVITYRTRTQSDISYRLNILTTNGQKITLMSGLKTVEDAQLLERRIETYLGIQDRYVRGEIGKVLSPQRRQQKSRKRRLPKRGSSGRRS